MVAQVFINSASLAGGERCGTQDQGGTEHSRKVRRNVAAVIPNVGVGFGVALPSREPDAAVRQPENIRRALAVTGGAA